MKRSGSPDKSRPNMWDDLDETCRRFAPPVALLCREFRRGALIVVASFGNQ